MQKIKVGLVGLGRAGWGMHTVEMDKFGDKFEITGSYDVIAERMDYMAKRYPNCKAHQSFESLINDPEIELVAIANRSPEHVKYNIAALEAGKIVFAEKPVALNYAEAMQLKAAADKHPGKLFCRQNRRFEAAFHHVSEIIASGILGKVFEIKLCRHSYNRRNDWQTLREFGGGQLANWGPHLIDHALQFINYEIESIWGDMKQIAASGDAEDHFKAVIRGKSGLVVDVEVSGGIALPSPVYAVYGSKGSLIANNENELHLKYLDVSQCTPQPAVDRTTPAIDAAPYHQQVQAQAQAQQAKWSAQSGPVNIGGLAWVEETIPTNPKSGATVNDIYLHLYRAIRENVPFPVKNEEAFEVVRVTEAIRNSALPL
jgi:predicted dehydrogenase